MHVAVVADHIGDDLVVRERGARVRQVGRFQAEAGHSADARKQVVLVDIANQVIPGVEFDIGVAVIHDLD